MRNATTMCVLAAALVPFATATVPMAAQAPFERIVAFGTSLSDSGNAFALRGGTNTPPDYLLDPLLIPSAPYARGGHHFSNGATWIEQLARSTGLAGTVRPAFASSWRNATNYAVGGARAYDDGININLGAQVSAFLQHSGDSATPDALYAIEFGGTTFAMRLRPSSVAETVRHCSRTPFSQSPATFKRFMEQPRTRSSRRKRLRSWRGDEL